MAFRTIEEQEAQAELCRRLIAENLDLRAKLDAKDGVKVKLPRAPGALKCALRRHWSGWWGGYIVVALIGAIVGPFAFFLHRDATVPVECWYIDGPGAQSIVPWGSYTLRGRRAWADDPHYEFESKEKLDEHLKKWDPPLCK